MSGWDGGVRETAKGDHLPRAGGMRSGGAHCGERDERLEGCGICLSGSFLPE